MILFTWMCGVLGGGRNSVEYDKKYEAPVIPFFIFDPSKISHT